MIVSVASCELPVVAAMVVSASSGTVETSAGDVSAEISVVDNVVPAVVGQSMHTCWMQQKQALTFYWSACPLSGLCVMRGHTCEIQHTHQSISTWGILRATLLAWTLGAYSAAAARIPHSTELAIQPASAVDLRIARPWAVAGDARKRHQQQPQNDWAMAKMPATKTGRT